MPAARSARVFAWLQLLFLMAGALLMVTPVLSSAALPSAQMPNRDSGVFLYVGRLILAGGIPYRDVWDHKPPAVFYIDALGLLLGGPQRWGVWLLEAIALLSAAGLMLSMLKRAFGMLPAVFGTGLMLFGLIELLELENFTELYALPLQVASLALFVHIDQSPRPWRRAVWLGVITACLFLLKPTLIGSALTIAFVLLVRWLRAPRTMKPLRLLLAIALGAAMLLLLVAAYFAVNGALEPMLDQVLRYNAYYSLSSAVDKLRALAAGSERLALPVLVAAAAWLIGLRELVTGKAPVSGQRLLLGLAVLGLPIEMTLSGIPGREYYHYFLAWLPAMAILGAYALAVLSRRLTFDRGHKAGWALLALSVLACLLAGRTLVQQIRPREDRRTAVANYVASATLACDTVLMWGAETSVNYVANRRSPSRYVYLYPLLTRGYQSPAMVQQFLADLKARPPALIIDSSPTASEIPSLDPAQRRTPANPNSPLGLIPEFQTVFAFVADNYTALPPVGAAAWPVYKLNSLPAARSCP